LHTPVESSPPQPLGKSQYSSDAHGSSANPPQETAGAKQPFWQIIGPSGPSKTSPSPQEQQPHAAVQPVSHIGGGAQPMVEQSSPPLPPMGVPPPVEPLVPPLPPDGVPPPPPVAPLPDVVLPPQATAKPKTRAKHDPMSKGSDFMAREISNQRAGGSVAKPGPFGCAKRECAARSATALSAEAAIEGALGVGRERSPRLSRSAGRAI